MEWVNFTVLEKFLDNMIMELAAHSWEDANPIFLGSNLGERRTDEQASEQVMPPH